MSHGVMDPRHWVRRRDPMVFVELKEGDEVKEKKKRRRERERRVYECGVLFTCTRVLINIPSFCLSVNLLSTFFLLPPLLFLSAAPLPPSHFLSPPPSSALPQVAFLAQPYKELADAIQHRIPEGAETGRKGGPLDPDLFNGQ